MAKFVERDQSQLYLLPVDMREWVPEDDLLHFVLEAVDRVPMSAFVVERARHGVGAIPPADDAGQRDIRFAANRAGDIPKHRRSVCGVELPP